jgi:reactive intermediate/imine deaminase
MRALVTAARPPAASPQTKNFAADDVAGQAEQVMQNMGAILTAAGSSYGQVVKTTILLVDMADFATVNEVYGKYFPSEPPARATFAVKGLPLGALVEIEATALL